MTLFSWLWIAWGVAFVVIEGFALYNKKKGDTLSEHVWSWFQLKGRKDGKKPWQVVLRLGFICFWAWLTFHFISGGSFL